MPDFKKMEIKFANTSSVVGVATFLYMFFGNGIHNHNKSAEFENGPKRFGSRNCSEKL